MQQRKTIDRKLTWYWIAGLALVSCIRFSFITANDVAMDEPFTVFHAQTDLHSLFRMLPGENNPPLFFLIMHFWINIFGISTLSIRVLPAMFSIFTAMMIFLTGRKFFSNQVGFFAAGLFTFSDYHQLFAHEARVYSLFALLAVLSMYFFLSLLKNPEKRRNVLLLALINALIIYAHFFGFFLFLIQFVSLLFIRGNRWPLVKLYLLSVMISFLAYLPYFKIFFSRFLDASAGGTWVEPPVISDLYTMIWRYLNAPLVTVTALGILMAALVKFLTGYRKKNCDVNFETSTVVIWFFLPYLLMFLVSFKIPMFLDRYTVFISIGFYFLIAIALHSLFSDQHHGVILGICYLVIMGFTFHPHVDNKRRLKDAVNAAVAGHTTQRSRIIICPSWLEYGFAYHYDQRIFTSYKNFRESLNDKGIFPANDFRSLDSVKFSGAEKVTIFEEWSELTDPRQTIKGYLDRNYEFLRSTDFYESYKVSYYIKKQGPPPFSAALR